MKRHEGTSSQEVWWRSLFTAPRPTIGISSRRPIKVNIDSDFWRRVCPRPRPVWPPVRKPVCAFVNDDLGSEVLVEQASLGVRLVALRCAGFNNVDLRAAQQHRIAISRVPVYSPHAVAEQTIALILTLNRKMHRAFNRVREGNFGAALDA